MAEIAEILSTYGSAAAAQSAAQDLICRNLAACVHVEGPVQSCFRWKGEVQQEVEWRLTVKTSCGLIEAVTAAIAASHPYDLPAITWYRSETTQAFADWIAAETSPAA